MLGLAGTGCATQPALEPTLERERELAGSTLHIAVHDGDAARADAAVEEAFAAFAATADRLRADRAASEIDVLNRVPMRIAIELSPETGSALGEALEVAEQTDGAYDPTLPPLLALWGLGPSPEGERTPPRRPRDFEIDMRLRQVDWSDVEVSASGTGPASARRLSRRTRIDLGPFAEGACVDAALAALREAGVRAARVRTSRVVAVHSGAGLPPWRVVVPSAAAPAIELRLSNGGVATAVPEPLFELDDGTTIHPLLDPRTGRPARGLRSATVVAGSARLAAAYAAAAFVMGEQAQAWLEARGDLRGVLRGEDGTSWTSGGLEWSTAEGP